MKKLFLIFMLILIVPFISAQDDYNIYSYLNLDFNLDSGISTVKTVSNPSLNFLITNLTLSPETDSRQSISTININSNPEAKITKSQGAVSFQWNELADHYSFSIDAKIKTNNIIYKVKDGQFPILDLDDSFSKYLEASENIDINENIINQASTLASGESDLFVVVFNIANWTKNNIRYDLNTLTATATQKSSWTLENKEGVCDEITSLFISMLRSVGIPAKFVSGMVYSNIDNKFGNHGWAEVYFPEYGWVPFDVTFGQYGWVDPSHIKLSESVDSATYSARYLWRSDGLTISPDELNLETKLFGTGPEIEPIFPLEIELLKNQVGPSSYIPIKITIENPFDSYVSTTLILTKAPELLEENSIQILLKPNQKKSFFWILKTPDLIDENYIYSSEVEVKDSFGSKAKTSLEYASHYPSYGLEEASSYINEFEKQETKTYSKDLSLKCSLDKNYYYNHETAKISCLIRNTGNTPLNNLNICLDLDCYKENLRISEEKNLNFSLNLKDYSYQQINITASNQDVYVSNFLLLKVFSKPDLRISSLNYLNPVSYNEDFDLELILNSEVLVKNIKIKINKLDPILIDSSQGPQKIVIPVKGSYFANSLINLNINYEDENGKKFELLRKSEIQVVNLPWYARFFSFFSNLF